MGFGCGSWRPSTVQAFGTSGSSGEDELFHQERQRIRQRLVDIRTRLCRRDDTDHERERVYAFSCAETMAILRAAQSTLERLVVLVLLTTGLRIGGLSRLRIPPTIQGIRQTMRACDVPAEWSTLEKNRTTRIAHGTKKTTFVPCCVQLSAMCRILVARWLSNRPAMFRSNGYLFPRMVSGGGDNDGRCVSTRFLWCVCRTVFDRADVHGPHVHPHTFRHTVIQLLYLVGRMGFDTIAKWIGHRSPSITSGIYGRLQHADLCCRLRGVPFLEDCEREAEGRREEWRAVAETIRRPPFYETEPHEWEGLPVASCRSESRSSRRMRLMATSQSLA